MLEHTQAEHAIEAGGPERHRVQVDLYHEDVRFTANGGVGRLDSSAGIDGDNRRSTLMPRLY
jgi:hypothetical protein